MIEAIFTPSSELAKRHIKEDDPGSLKRAHDAALLHRAIGLAIESAFRFGQDLPVGAVVANDHAITGRYYASDVRLDWAPMHAEVMALIDSEYNSTAGDPNTLVVNLEP
jgi:pyrimidine deaminase RibD-like protein